jgi:hypothetical protein
VRVWRACCSRQFSRLRCDVVGISTRVLLLHRVSAVEEGVRQAHRRCFCFRTRCGKNYLRGPSGLVIVASWPADSNSLARVAAREMVGRYDMNSAIWMCIHVYVLASY